MSENIPQNDESLDPAKVEAQLNAEKEQRKREGAKIVEPEHVDMMAKALKGVVFAEQIKARSIDKKPNNEEQLKEVREALKAEPEEQKEFVSSERIETPEDLIKGLGLTEVKIEASTPKQGFWARLFGRFSSHEQKSSETVVEDTVPTSEVRPEPAKTIWRKVNYESPVQSFEEQKIEIPQETIPVSYDNTSAYTDPTFKQQINKIAEEKVIVESPKEITPTVHKLEPKPEKEKKVRKTKLPKKEEIPAGQPIFEGDEGATTILGALASLYNTNIELADLSMSERMSLESLASDQKKAEKQTAVKESRIKRLISGFSETATNIGKNISERIKLPSLQPSFNIKKEVTKLTKSVGMSLEQGKIKTKEDVEKVKEKIAAFKNSLVREVQTGPIINEYKKRRAQSKLRDYFQSNIAASHELTGKEQLDNAQRMNKLVEQLKDITGETEQVEKYETKVDEDLKDAFTQTILDIVDSRKGVEGFKIPQLYRNLEQYFDPKTIKTPEGVEMGTFVVEVLEGILDARENQTEKYSTDEEIKPFLQAFIYQKKKQLGIQ